MSYNYHLNIRSIQKFINNIHILINPAKHFPTYPHKFQSNFPTISEHTILKGMRGWVNGWCKACNQLRSCSNTCNLTPRLTNASRDVHDFDPIKIPYYWRSGIPVNTWGLSIRRGPVSSAWSSSPSGNTGLSFRTVVSMLTVDTVTWKFSEKMYVKKCTCRGFVGSIWWFFFMVNVNVVGLLYNERYLEIFSWKDLKFKCREGIFCYVWNPFCTIEKCRFDIWKTFQYHNVYAAWVRELCELNSTRLFFSGKNATSRLYEI